MPRYQVCLKLHYSQQTSNVDTKRHCSYYVVETTALDEVIAGQKAARELLKGPAGQYCYKYEVDSVAVMEEDVAAQAKSSVETLIPVKPEQTFKVYVSSDLVGEDNGLNFVTEHDVNAVEPQLAKTIAILYHKRDWSINYRSKRSQLVDTKVVITLKGQLVVNQTKVLASTLPRYLIKVSSKVEPITHGGVWVTRSPYETEHLIAAENSDSATKLAVTEHDQAWLDKGIRDDKLVETTAILLKTLAVNMAADTAVLTAPLAKNHYRVTVTSDEYWVGSTITVVTKQHTSEHFIAASNEELALKVAIHYHKATWSNSDKQNIKLRNTTAVVILLTKAELSSIQLVEVDEIDEIDDVGHDNQQIDEID